MERVGVLKFGREQGLGEVLEADGACEAVNGKAAHGGEPWIGSGGVGASMDHGMRDFDAGGESVEDDAAGFLLEDLDEFAIGGKVVFVAEDGGGEMAGKGAGGLEVVLCFAAADNEGIGAEDFVGEFRLAQELVEGNREELCLGVEWPSAVAVFRRGVRLGGEGELLGTSGRSSIIFASNSTGEKREGMRLFDEGFEFIAKGHTLR